MTFYFFKNKKVVLLTRFIDQCLAFFAKKKPYTGSPPQKILLSNIAHLGDLIMATAVLPVLRKAFPNAKIGFVIGSWNLEVLETHPMVDHIYVFDHMKINRVDKSFLKKFWKHFITRYKTLKALRKEQYDVAIDLYYYFPNAALLFSQAHIPFRFGYSSGGLGPLFTTSFDYQEINQHVSKYYIPLLKELKINEEALYFLQMNLPSSKVKGASYVILHMGVGDVLKEWEDLKWQELIRRFLDAGVKLVFTGKGGRELSRIEALMPSAGMNLCNQLSFSELVSCVKQASLVIAPDTGIIHIASAVNTPSVVLFSSHVNPSQYIQDPKITEKMFLSDSAEMVYKRAHESLNHKARSDWGCCNGHAPSYSSS